MIKVPSKFWYESARIYRRAWAGRYSPYDIGNFWENVCSICNNCGIFAHEYCNLIRGKYRDKTIIFVKAKEKIHIVPLGGVIWGTPAWLYGFYRYENHWGFFTIKLRKRVENVDRFAHFMQNSSWVEALVRQGTLAILRPFNKLRLFGNTLINFRKVDEGAGIPCITVRMARDILENGRVIPELLIEVPPHFSKNHQEERSSKVYRPGLGYLLPINDSRKLGNLGNIEHGYDVSGRFAGGGLVLASNNGLYLLNSSIKCGKIIDNDLTIFVPELLGNVDKNSAKEVVKLLKGAYIRLASGILSKALGVNIRQVGTRTLREVMLEKLESMVYDRIRFLDINKLREIETYYGEDGVEWALNQLKWQFQRGGV